MNLPVFCKFLKDLPLKDVDVGTQVLDIINSAIPENTPPFEYSMTGNEMYIHYKSLDPGARMGLENLELLSPTDWISLARQCESLHEIKRYKERTHDLHVKTVYVILLLLCFLTSAFMFVGYFANLGIHSDRPTSYLLDISEQIIDYYSTPEGQQF